MYTRLCKPLISNSFFIFGPRGTGKTSLLKQDFIDQNCLWINLLDSEMYQYFSINPGRISEAAKAKKYDWIIIDEVQKIPALLDHVHDIIESDGIRFILTGSSARKLRRDGANLLAGRAFLNNLHPLTYLELGKDFDLLKVLNWGSLPKIFHLKEEIEYREFLRTYTHTYLKEEIKEEQVVRNIEPFIKFLEVAAQMNGKIINYSKISRDAGTDSKAVQRYFEILSDTLVGFFLEPFHTSVRKRQMQKAKFYFFDIGVTKALANLLTVPTIPKTSQFGLAFEHFFILEAKRLNDYFRKDYKFSYLMTKDDLEIDLIVERPGKSKVLIEIKSSTSVDDQDVSRLNKIKKDLEPCELWVVSLESVPRATPNYQVLPWKDALSKLYLD